MVHKASLLHDDLIDQAAERRGLVAFHRRHSPALAIVVGDLLLSTATQIVGRTLNSYRPERKDQIQNEFHNMVVNLARGELLALAVSRDFEVRGYPGSNRAVAGESGAGSTLEQLLNANSLKSASLIEGACRLGALVANCANAESYARVGYALGCIFQLLDDLADMDEDLRALRLTPPLAWMLSHLAGDYPDLHVTFLAGALPMTESGRLSQLLDWAGDQLDRWLADGWDAVRDISPGASRDVLTAVLGGIEASLARWRVGAAHTG